MFCLTNLIFKETFKVSYGQWFAIDLTQNCAQQGTGSKLNTILCHEQSSNLRKDFFMQKEAMASLLSPTLQHIHGETEDRSDGTAHFTRIGRPCSQQTRPLVMICE